MVEPTYCGHVGEMETRISEMPVSRALVQTPPTSKRAGQPSRGPSVGCPGVPSSDTPIHEQGESESWEGTPGGGRSLSQAVRRSPAGTPSAPGRAEPERRPLGASTAGEGIGGPRALGSGRGGSFLILTEAEWGLPVLGASPTHGLSQRSPTYR